MTDTKTPVLSLERIRQLDPCEAQMERVEQQFPHGVPLDWESIQQASDYDIDVDWAIARLVPKAKFRSFAQALYRDAYRLLAPVIAKHKDSLDPSFLTLWKSIPRRLPRNIDAATTLRRAACEIDLLVYQGDCGYLTWDRYNTATLSWALREAVCLIVDAHPDPEVRFSAIECCIVDATREAAVRWVLEHVFNIPQPAATEAD